MQNVGGQISAMCESRRNKHNTMAMATNAMTAKPTATTVAITKKMATATTTTANDESDCKKNDDYYNECDCND